MENKEILKINFYDVDEKSTSVGYIVINKGNYVIDMDEAYIILKSLCNSGNDYISYKEYLEDDNADIEIVKNNFDRLVNATLSYGWSIKSFTEVLNVLYPNSDATYLQEDSEYTFSW